MKKSKLHRINDFLDREESSILPNEMLELTFGATGSNICSNDDCVRRKNRIYNPQICKTNRSCNTKPTKKRNNSKSNPGKCDSNTKCHSNPGCQFSNPLICANDSIACK